MSLDPKYVALSSLGAYFVDKSTGLPLTSGHVYFYSDINRSNLKPIYELSGSPPNYSYTQITNPLILSGVGTFVDDSDNPIIPYGYPYDINGNPENYFIEIYSTVDGIDSVLQATIPAWPGTSSGNTPTNSNELFNYIPNGQFLLHNNLPEDEINNIPAGQIRQATTVIAPGNWTFERPSTSTATDNVTFFEYGQYVSNPSASPRFAVQIQCLGSDPSDAFKYLKVYFNDVNKFSSNTDQYTFAFVAQTFDSGNFTVALNLIKFYGTGGSPSPTQITQLTTFTITSSLQIFQFSFPFGANTGNQVGNNGDDYVALAISCPTNLSFGGRFGNVILTPGNVTISGFPPTTNKDFNVRSDSNLTPNYDGFDLYLPKIETPNGMIADQSQVGLVFAKLKVSNLYFDGSISTISNEIICDGGQYLSTSYSPLGIPFNRLWQRLFNSTLLQPTYGTGTNFVSTYTQGGVGSSANLFFFENSLGSPSPPVNGTLSAGITFFPVFSGNSPGYGLNAYATGATTLFARATTAGYVSPILATILNDGIPFDPGTSGFTMLLNRNPQTVASKMLFTMTVTSATGLAGKYFRFSTLPGPTIYYVWFTVDGSGSDPAPGGTGIRVDLKSTFSASDINEIILSVLSGKQSYYLTFPSSITAGAYWTFRVANGDSYYIWYTVDGSGSDPAPGGILGIKVALLSSDTAQIITQKSMTAINSTYYAVPDLRGMILKGYDFSQNWDSGNRFGVTPGNYAENFLGTYQADMVIAHTHQIPWNTTIVGGGGGPTTQGATMISGSAVTDYGPTNNFNRGGSLYSREYGFLTPYTDSTNNNYGDGTAADPQTSGANAAVVWVVKY